LPDPKPIADFIMQSVFETNSPPPAFVAGESKRPSLQHEDSIADSRTTRNILLAAAPCSHRATTAINLTSAEEEVLTIIAPKTVAPGIPWVFRAGFVGRDATVDLALLAKGFYIVTGPVPTDVGPVPAQWTAAYKYLTDHAFFQKTGHGRCRSGAGEAYAWAMENPDKVSCYLCRESHHAQQPLKDTVA